MCDLMEDMLSAVYLGTSNSVFISKHLEATLVYYKHALYATQPKKGKAIYIYIYIYAHLDAKGKHACSYGHNRISYSS